MSLPHTDHDDDPKVLTVLILSPPDSSCPSAWQLLLAATLLCSGLGLLGYVAYQVWQVLHG